MREEAGFTIVEAMVAAFVVLVGVLGSFLLIDAGSRATTSNVNRDVGNNVAREVVERVRQQPYGSMVKSSTAAIGAATAALVKPTVSGSSALSGASWTVTRGATYTVTLTVCSVDDPSDGVGAIDDSYCSYVSSPTPLPTDGQGGGTGVVNLHVLGLDLGITTTTTLTSVLCSLLGTNTSVDSALGLNGALSSLAGAGADVKVCTASNKQFAIDDNPDDLKRVIAKVSWTRPRAASVTQTTIIPSPGNGT